jgi:hypothetical protein
MESVLSSDTSAHYHGVTSQETVIFIITLSRGCLSNGDVINHCEIHSHEILAWVWPCGTSRGIPQDYSRILTPPPSPRLKWKAVFSGVLLDMQWHRCGSSLTSNPSTSGQQYICLLRDIRIPDKKSGSCQREILLHWRGVSAEMSSSIKLSPRNGGPSAEDNVPSHSTCMWLRH